MNKLKRFILYWPWQEPPDPKPAPEIKYEVRIIKRDPCRLRMHEWRSDEALANLAHKVLWSPEFRQMLDVVERECPSNMFLVGASTQARAEAQCRIEGYLMALTNLEKLGIFEKPTEPIESTFEVPEEEQRK